MERGSSTIDLAPTAANTPLPHLACIETHLSAETWGRCVEAMTKLCQNAEVESVQVKAFEALTKVLEISESARVARQKPTFMAGGTLNLSADEVNVSVDMGELDAMRQRALEANSGAIDAKAQPHAELDAMVRQARDGIEPNGGGNGQTD